MGTTSGAALSLDNNNGNSTAPETFVVDSISNPVPLGNVVAFGHFEKDARLHSPSP